MYKDMAMRRFLNRQNIITGLMVIAVLYGLYELFLQSHVRKALVGSGKNVSEFKGLIQQMSTDLAQNRQSLRNQYIISRAEAAWSRDPFYDQKAYREWKLSLMKQKDAPSTKTAAAPLFNYTGYLEDKGKKFAIINGTEYMAGEPLDLEGYILQKISSSRVIIQNRANRRHFDVPFQE